MKYGIVIVLAFVAEVIFAQTAFPDFLQGIWKIEDKELYEHWDKLNDNSLKGFSYQIENGQMVVMEYLTIERKKKQTIYTANVLNQNEGKTVPFKLSIIGKQYIFENPKHDFPNKISYELLNENEIFVQVSGLNKKGFSYKMIKQKEKSSIKDTTIANPNYDSELAQMLGGDDYGMKSYIWVILKSGENESSDKAFVNSCFRGHLDNINRLVDEGILIVAGPLGKNDKSYRGIFILQAKSIEEAEKTLQTDPAIKEGLLAYELYNWYGSAALPLYLESSDKIWKVSP